VCVCELFDGVREGGGEGEMPSEVCGWRGVGKKNFRSGKGNNYLFPRAATLCT
jgi:hypothetical protein